MSDKTPVFAQRFSYMAENRLFALPAVRAANSLIAPSLTETRGIAVLCVLGLAGYGGGPFGGPGGGQIRSGRFFPAPIL